MALEIAKLGEHTGAEASGVDLRQPLDAEVRQQLNDALVEHVALVVRDQQLDASQFLAAMRNFGEPIEQNFTKYLHKAEKLVNHISNTFAGKDGERVYHSNYWHTDHTNREEPPAYTSLYAIELPKSGGGRTGIANMRAGYEHLPQALKARIDGLSTVNLFQGSAATAKSHRYALSRRAIEDRPVVHPLVRTHPVSGKKAIYMHQGKVENFVGMQPQESQDLIAELLEEAIRPEFTYYHDWRLGDLFIWDDRSTMHMAMADYDLNETRTLYRVLIKGDRPY
ncbi:MAG: taurine dioxygenase [Gammaproteobacteria bacterium]|jgi:taurine dioxygenase